jgi:hypothetical protein
MEQSKAIKRIIRQLKESKEYIGLLDFYNTAKFSIYGSFFNEVAIFNEKYLLARKKNMLTLIDKDGNFILGRWFNGIYQWKGHDGLFEVWDDEMNVNIIKENGQLLSPIWFDYISLMDNCIKVRRDGKFNLLSIDGKFLSDKWYDGMGQFNKNGIALIRINGFEYNLIDTNGKLLLKKNYNIEDVFLNGMIKFRNHKLYGLMNMNEEIIYEPIYSEITSDDNGSLIFAKDSRVMIVNKDMKPISTMFEHIAIKPNGRYIVTLNGQMNVIDENGKYLSKEWYDNIEYIYGSNGRNGLFRIKRDNLYNVLNIVTGGPLYKNWMNGIIMPPGCIIRLSNHDGVIFDDNEGIIIDNNGNLTDIHLNYYLYEIFDSILIEYREHQNIVTKDKKLLFNEWYDKINLSDKYPYCVLEKNGEFNIADIYTGKLLFNEWKKEFEISSQVGKNLWKVENSQMEFNFINEKGELKSDIWFTEKIVNFINTDLIYTDGKKLYKIDENGKCEEYKIFN